MASVCSGDGTAEYVVWAHCVVRNQKQGLAVTPLRPVPSGLDLPARPHVQGFHNLPKQHHQLETKCSNMWAFGNIFHLNNDPINGGHTASDKKLDSLSDSRTARDKGQWNCSPPWSFPRRSVCRVLVLSVGPLICSISITWEFATYSNSQDIWISFQTFWMSLGLGLACGLARIGAWKPLFLH